MRRRPVQIMFALLSAAAGVLALALLLSGAAPVRASSPRYVAKDGTCGGAEPCYADIQPAVDAAQTGDEIRVAAGVYYTVSTRHSLTQVVYIDKDLTIRGGYTTSNWITADPVANPVTLTAGNQGRVVYITGDISVTLEGLRLVAGRATGLGGHEEGGPGYDAGSGVYAVTATVTLRQNWLYDDGTAGGDTYGGGVYVRNGWATLQDNTIQGCHAAYGGGLVFYSSAVTLTGNTIAGNEASSDGGGAYALFGGAALTGNTVTANTAQGSGGGISLNTCSATLNGNTLAANATGGHGGGLYLASGDAELDGNTILGNSAGGSGGGLYLHGDARLVNNVVADNQATGEGGGLHIVRYSPILLHTTVARNGGPSGICVTDDGDVHSTLAMTNTILVSHTVGITVTADNTARLAATLWQGNASDCGGPGTVVTGTHNYQGNPAFANPGGGNYHIGAGSAARDRGVAAGVMTDIDGEARSATTPDLGADEVVGALPAHRTYLPLVLR